MATFNPFQNFTKARTPFTGAVGNKATLMVAKASEIANTSKPEAVALGHDIAPVQKHYLVKALHRVTAPLSYRGM